MALGELEVQTLLVREFAVILVAGGALSFALSFGLGSRDISRNILAGMYIRKIIRVGDEIEVEGRRGQSGRNHLHPDHPSGWGTVLHDQQQRLPGLRHLLLSR